MSQPPPGGELRRWPLLLVAAVFIIIAALRLATEADEDPWAAGAWSVGAMMLGMWTVLEVQRLSGHRRGQPVWPGDGEEL